MLAAKLTPLKSPKVRFRLLTLLVAVAICACVFSMMKPFSADVTMALVSFDPVNEVATIEVLDESLLGRLIYMRPNKDPMVSLMGADSRSEGRISSTAEWGQIPHDAGLQFVTPTLVNLESPVTMSIQVRSRFSDSYEWVSLVIDKQAEIEK